MPGLQSAGVLPIALVNPGLAAAPPVYAAQIADLTSFAGKLTGAAADQVKFKINPPPSLAELTARVAAYAASLPVALNPAGFITTGAAFSADLSAEALGLAGTISLLDAVSLQYQTGLAAGDIAAWCYSGPAGGFGPAFTARSWGKTQPSDAVSATVFITEGLSTWQTFSKSINTGRSSSGPARLPILSFLGLLSGFEVNTGVLALNAPFLGYRNELKGREAAITQQLQVSLGLNLPSPTFMLDALSGIDLSQVVTVITDLKVDFGAEASAVLAKADALSAALGDITLQLGSTGPGLYAYGGRAGDLGQAIKDTFANGIPGSASGANATVYALVLSGSGPSWAALSQIVRGG